MTAPLTPEEEADLRFTMKRAADDHVFDFGADADDYINALLATLDAARSTSEGPNIICGAKHPNGKTTCRRQPGHDDDHGTARLDVTWAAALRSEDEG